jgi:hypothetical protein
MKNSTSQKDIETFYLPFRYTKITIDFTRKQIIAHWKMITKKTRDIHPEFFFIYNLSNFLIHFKLLKESIPVPNEICHNFVHSF